VSRLLIWSFGTKEETNRFKARAIGDGFLGADAMDEPAPRSLRIGGGMQSVQKAGTTTWSFYGLRPGVWAAPLSTGRPYHEEFGRWIRQVLAAPVHCLYLNGHHEIDAKHHATMYWDKDGKEIFYLFMGTGDVVFGTVDKTTKQAANKVMLETKNLRAECLLLVGFGCNVAAPNQSLHYQSYLGEARKPIVLGWATEMETPSGGLSMNLRFFDYLKEYATKRGNVPPGDRLRWFYENEPFQLVRAWGYAALGFQGGGQKSLWEGARARNVDGTYYRFEAKEGRAEPVKA
jgi:hypothetical protein